MSIIRSKVQPKWEVSARQKLLWVGAGACIGRLPAALLSIVGIVVPLHVACATTQA